jgi:hypothetical protein
MEWNGIKNIDELYSVINCFGGLIIRTQCGSYALKSYSWEVGKKIIGSNAFHIETMKSINEIEINERYIVVVEKYGR